MINMQPLLVAAAFGKEGRDMKIRIEVDEEREEEEVLIRCREINEEIIQLEKSLRRAEKEFQNILLYRDKTEYYYPVRRIYFFETEGDAVYAHTEKESFLTEMKLYELEEFLPESFVRISKSTIVNMRYIYSITRNVTASSEVKLMGTHKQVFVSRNYYKQLREKLVEMRMRR